MAERLYKYVDNDLLDNFQIIQSRARELDPNKKKIYWVHDLATDPEVQHLKDGGWQKYDKIVFVSHWQQEQYHIYLGVPYFKGIVLRNAIDPIPFHRKSYEHKIKLIYYSTPHRGLNILYPAFNALTQKFAHIELDVYSSFNLYGWPQRDEPFKELFKALEEHPQINYHGAVSNEEIREAIQKAHIFAYPSTWQETSCLCLIEAMSAGLLCIHSSLAALSETSMGLTGMYGYTEDPQEHAHIIFQKLYNAIMLLQDENYTANLENNLHITKQLTDSTYGWENRAKEWTSLLKNMLTQTK